MLPGLWWREIVSRGTVTLFAEGGDSSLLAECAGWDDCRRPMGAGQLPVACPVISVHTAKRSAISCRQSVAESRCCRSSESNQSCSLKVTTPGDSPFEIRWL